VSAIDPVVVLALRGALAMLFAAAAWHKLRDPAGFRASLRDYRLLPDPLVPAVGGALAAGEGAVALGLLLPPVAPAAALAAAALLALYGAAIAANLARGRRHVACGCLGPAGDQPLHGGLLARNALLLAAGLAAARAPEARALAWLDAFTVAATVATLALLYLAADGLLAARARTARAVS